MKDWFPQLCLALLAGGSLWLVTHRHPAGGGSAQPAPAPVVVPVPVPAPPPAPPEKPRRKPLWPLRDGVTPGAEAAGAIVGGAAASFSLIGAQPNAPDGTEPQCDFPDDLWMKNIGSKKDGAGMCVFTSFEHMCLWAGLEEFRGFRNWCAERYPGGGYPSKLAKLVKAYCQAKQIPASVFDPERDMIQYEGPSPDVLDAAMRQGILTCTTLYYSPRYRGRVYHMVNCAHFDSKNYACLDNNFRPLEWASREEGIRRMSLNGRLWFVCVLKPGPPPMPRNK